jgi:nitrate/nitrite transport system permease protein
MQAILKLFGTGGLRDPREILRSMLLSVGVPVLAMVVFLAVWATLAPRIQTSLGAVPGPAQVLDQAHALWVDHFAERQKRKEFYERQEARNKERIAADPAYQPRQFEWTGKRTYLDQIVTSLVTVFTGFLLATVLAVPVGILAGSSRIVQAAINPIVQIFRPVSPLAWLPIVTLIVSAVYVTSGTPMF